MNDARERYEQVVRLFRDHARREGVELAEDHATPEEVAEAERRLGAGLPASYRRFQFEFGSLRDSPIDIYSVRPCPPAILNIVDVNRDARAEFAPRLPARLIAFSDNGAGDYLCFDISAAGADECPIVWWDHTRDEAQTPAPAADGFLDWLEETIAERDADRKGSRLEQAGHVWRHWLQSWFGRP